MKSLKTKLILSIAMMLVAAIMTTGVSFAWFTISTNPEIANISTSVAANGNLEIALRSTATATSVDDSAVGDSGKNIKWGNLIDLSKFTFDSLKPVSFTSGNGSFDSGSGCPAVSAPEFGLDGRIKSVVALTATAKSGNGSEPFNDGVIFAYVDSNNNVWAYRIDFFMRSNVDGTVSLSTAAARGAGEDGLGSTITPDSNVTVAFSDGTNFVVAGEGSGSGTLSAEVTTLTANVVKCVSMYIYVDGVSLTNADMFTSDYAVAINVQFKHSATLDPLDITGSGNGRISSGS